MKKQKIEREKYTLTEADIYNILGLRADQRITDIRPGHASTKFWIIELDVETTMTTELTVPTHHKEK